MTLTNNAFTSYDAKGIREDLSDLISNISPTDTPFMNGIGKMGAENVKFEWQTDSLVAATTNNAQIEGDDITTYDTTAATTRVANYAQISRKTVVISGTEEVLNKAGRKSELAYQLTKKTKELKRDMETILCANQASTAGTAGAARTTGTLRAWISTNSSLGASGVNGGYVATTGLVSTATDGTQRALTETLLKVVVKTTFAAGGDPNMLMVGPFNKQVVSGFTGNNTRMQDTSDRKLITSIDVYRSDYGTFNVVPNRFQRERDAFLLQTDKWKVAYVRPLNVKELATTGDAQKRLIIAEYGLMSANEAASAVIADLTTS